MSSGVGRRTAEPAFHGDEPRVSRSPSRRAPRSCAWERHFRHPNLPLTALSSSVEPADKPDGERSQHERQSLDLRQQKFRSKFRGFDPVEVGAFWRPSRRLREAALRETDRLRQELNRVEGMLTELRQHEGSLKSTLIAAQRLADDIKANAERKRAASSATRKGVPIFSSRRRSRGSRTFSARLTGLRLKRRDVETSIESTIQTLRNTLEYVREQEAREREDKILLHRPRIVDRPVRAGSFMSARQGVGCLVRVIPRARKTECTGVRDGALVIRVAAPPVEAPPTTR